MNKRYFLSALCLGISITLFQISCSKSSPDPTPPPPPPPPPTSSCTGTAGPKFTAVKNLIAAKCQSCHNGTTTEGGMNWTVNCNIVQNSARIKVRAVDIGDMPQGGPMLTAGEKALITDWITAGGQLTN